ncbi:hypothetical protein SK128_023217 [Halocaridina rubra]|uniref:Uncharacterized protein n=1 Tax=Halocaridina rubra TaxID=373956 RepID=A0AAN8XT38_HALRR
MQETSLPYSSYYKETLEKNNFPARDSGKLFSCLPRRERLPSQYIRVWDRSNSSLQVELMAESEKTPNHF